jgi:predicted metal-dependent phosphoesterase TrpH
MVEKGYCKEPKDAFPEYLGRNGLAYVERAKMTPEDAMQLLLKVGGVPVLAHPAYLSDLDTILPQLKDAGLMGMEVYYSRFDPDTIKHLQDLANRYDLIPSGGSDYHGLGNADEPLPGSMGPPVSVVERLEQAARNVAQTHRR